MTTNNQTSPEDSLALWYIENPNSGTPFVDPVTAAWLDSAASRGVR